MVVHTQTERVLETRKSIMEFHLVNHPLDCPVCDQAGECWLQIYYMRHGLYDPRMTDEKVHKPKAVPLGPHVMLDAERCILCSRCVRFCDEVTGTGELGIFNRGDHSEIGLFPGKTLENKYSGNVIDICPVGALTDRDFRFQVRVWYLDTAKSVCNGCARGCNIEVHTNRRRPHHNQGRRIARHQAAPQRRRQPVVDVRRGPLRLPLDRRRQPAPGAPRPARGGQGRRSSAGTRRWPTLVARPPALPARGDRHPRLAPDVERGPVRAAADRRSSSDRRGRPSRCRPRVPGDEDNLLIRADKNPNRRGAELIGLAPAETAAHPGRGAAAAGQAPVGLPARPARLAGCRGRRDRGPGRAREMVVFQGTERERHERGRRTWCCRARPTSSARAPSPTSRGGCSASAPWWSRSARRWRTGTSSAGSARALGGADPALAATRAEQVFPRWPARCPPSRA